LFAVGENQVICHQEESSDCGLSEERHIEDVPSQDSSRESHSQSSDCKPTELETYSQDDYEAIRKENIERNQQMLVKLGIPTKFVGDMITPTKRPRYSNTKSVAQSTTESKAGRKSFRKKAKVVTYNEDSSPRSNFQNTFVPRMYVNEVFSEKGQIFKN